MKLLLDSEMYACDFIMCLVLWNVLHWCKEKRTSYLAPDLLNGHCKRSKQSDTYSLGRVMKQVNTNHLKVPGLDSLSSLCMEYYCTSTRVLDGTRIVKLVLEYSLRSRDPAEGFKVWLV